MPANEEGGFTVPELMEAAIETFQERNASYGDAYKRFGKFMVVLFPDGVKIRTLEDWNKLGVLCQICNCLSRLAASDLTHNDSARDLGVFSFMLEELIQ